MSGEPTVPDAIGAAGRPVSGGVLHIHDYQLTCIGGLEDVALDEVRSHLGRAATAVRSERGATGRIFLRTTVSPRRLLELRCPTGVHAVAAQAHDVTVGAPGLARIERCLRQLPVDAVQRLARACLSQVDGAACRLRVSVHGAHRFTAAQVEATATATLRQLGIAVAPSSADPEACLDLAVHVRGRRALVTVRLGPRRPVGDPQHEGWQGPASAVVARLLDLDPGLPLAGVPGGVAASLWLRAGEADLTVRGRCGALPLAAAGLPVLLQSAATPAAEAAALAEAARVVVPGGIAALLVTQGEAFAARLQAARLPLEVMGAVPFYVRRRRWALFLLERLELLGIEPA